MKDQDFLAIKDRLPELRKQVVNSPHGRIPKSIAYLEEVLRNEPVLDDKVAVYGLLLGECTRSRNDDVYVHFLRQRVKEIPQDPFSYTELGTVLAHERSTQAEALKVAAQAVALAKKQDRQVKYSLTCQARVALEAGDYKVFNDTLRALIEDVDKHRAEDHGFEFDFLDHVDQSKVDQTLVSRYRALAS